MFIFPKVSCLMITKDGREEMFLKSYQSFKNQVYQNKQLVVITDGTEDYKNFIKNTVDSSTKLIFLKGKYSLGSLRNIGIRLCDGDYFVQWDDDDFNGPNRISFQLKHLLYVNKPVCYFSDQLHYYFQTNQVFWESWKDFHSGHITKYSLIPGTIMAKIPFVWRYPSIGDHCKAGEDTVLAYQICEEDEENITLLSEGLMMIYSFHGKNVWDLNHHLKLSNERAKSIFDVLEKRDIIDYTLSSLNLHEVKVMGRNGLAYVSS